MRRWASLLCPLLLLTSAHAQSARGLWVLQAPDQFVAYDLATFAAKGAVTVPQRVVEHSEFAAVNASGQLIFRTPEGLQLGTGAVERWFWDGGRSREVNPFSEVFLTADVDISVTSSARVWRTDLAGGAEQTLVTIPASASCACETGVCSETCPEWSMWAPHGVVSDLFVLTRFIQGQLQTTYEESVVYRRSGQRWLPTRLERPLERVFAASDTGDLLISVLMDTGCCGWINERSDQTMLLANGRPSVLFDEWARFNNRNYDVSFYTTSAQFAPGNALVAHTIAGDVIPADAEIRLSSGGKANAGELARVRATIADLPFAEIVTLGTPPHKVTTLPRTAVVGWLSDRELLVAQEGHLAVYDASGKKVRDTPIRVRSAADAFLR